MLNGNLLDNFCFPLVEINLLKPLHRENEWKHSFDVMATLSFPGEGRIRNYVNSCLKLVQIFSSTKPIPWGTIVPGGGLFSE